MRPSKTDPDPGPAPLTVFYNAGCPVCRREIDHYRRYAEDRGLPLTWTDVAAEPGILARRGIDPEAQRRRLHAMTPDGRVVAGVDAFDLMWRRMPRFRWLAGLMQPRLMRAVARFGYDRLLAPALHRLDRRRRRHAKNVCLPQDYRNCPPLDPIGTSPRPPTVKIMTNSSLPPLPAWPTSITVFFDGSDRRLRQSAARYRRASHGRRDIRWRDLRTCPDALRLFGIPREDTHQLFVVDRAARLRGGLDARIKLWAELPGWRMLATVLTVTGIKALVARPLTPGRRSHA